MTEELKNSIRTEIDKLTIASVLDGVNDPTLRGPDIPRRLAPSVVRCSLSKVRSVRSICVCLQFSTSLSWVTPGSCMHVSEQECTKSLDSPKAKASCSRCRTGFLDDSGRKSTSYLTNSCIERVSRVFGRSEGSVKFCLVCLLYVAALLPPY